MNSIRIFTTLILILMVVGCAHAGNFSSAMLKRTSLTYDKEKWEEVSVNAGSGMFGGTNFSIAYRGRPIGIAVSEHLDSTQGVVNAVVLDQMNEFMKKNTSRFESADKNSKTFALKTSVNWICSHNISAPKKYPDRIGYYSHCIWIGLGFWDYIVIVTPLDVSSAEIQAINKSLMAIAPIKH